MRNSVSGVGGILVILTVLGSPVFVLAGLTMLMAVMVDSVTVNR